MSAAQQEPCPSGATWAEDKAPDAPRGAKAARIFRSRAVRRIVLPVIRRRFNPLVMTLIGSKRLKMTTVIHHRGRRSGRPYATPTSARPTADGFVVPMTFGPQADWYRNVQAAGGCVIEWNGAEYPAVQPEVVGWTTARSAFTRGERIVLRLMGMESFVRLRNTPAGGSDPTVRA